MKYTDESFCDTLNSPFIFTGFLASCFIIFFVTMTSITGVPKDTTVPYASKYYDTFAELENDTMTDDEKIQLRNIYMKEITDDDYSIIISYSFRDETFHYWGENNIPFSTLDSAAQLYAIENKCKSICVDYRSEIYKASEKIEELKKRREEESEKIIGKTEEPALDSPFASFKKYNTTTSRAAKNTSIIPEKCNHFRRKGTLDEWILANGSSNKWINSINSATAKTMLHNNTDSIILQPVTYSDWKSKATNQTI